MFAVELKQKVYDQSAYIAGLSKISGVQFTTIPHYIKKFKTSTAAKVFVSTYSDVGCGMTSNDVKVVPFPKV